MRAYSVIGLQPMLWQKSPTVAATVYATLLCLLIAVPLASSYVEGLMAEILVMAIFAMSLDLLIGYVGLMSLGHAAFFGLGAYGTVLLGVQLGLNGWLAMAGAMLLSVVGASAIGFFCVRVSGIAFLMLTMAFAQLLHSVGVKWRDVTGGTDGLGGFVRPSLFGHSLDDSAVLYYVVLAGFIVVFWLLMRLIRSPLGSVLVGIRENEQRMRAIGYAVPRYKLLVFVVAGAFAGFAGSLYAFLNAFVSPEVLSWHFSGDGIVMVILGGAGSIVGPAVGSAVFVMLRNVVSGFNEHWLLWVGIAFVMCVMFMPTGLYGLTRKVLRRRSA
jgi:branched-chain amino acid transport system permease protein